MNRLEKLKNEKGEEEVEANCEWSYNTDEYLFCLDMWHLGFDASSAEYEKIIAELEGALKYIAITKYGLQGYFEENDEKGAYQYISNLAFEYESKARNALQKLKEFKK